MQGEAQIKPLCYACGMKRIVILCDGTWNSASSATPTNVVHLGRALRPVDSDDIPQVPIYVPGVGTGKRGVTWLGRKADQLLGGLMGLGLIENVVEAYTHLVFLYEPGDEIYIFGFSRGAFTARSLTGLIRSSGLLPRAGLNNLDKIVARYRRRGDPTTHPDSVESQRFRAQMSPDLMTSPEDAKIYAEEGSKDPFLLRIAYLGVWDSVGALGLPKRFALASLVNRRYRFHNAALSSMVESARHAVALDERRREFEPTHWDNLPILNKGKDPENLPYQERYFAGDHGAVGGGGDITALSSIALEWVMEGAEAARLRFDPAVRAALVGQQDPFGSLTNTAVPKGGLFAALMRRLGHDREGPTDLAQVHGSVKARWAFEAKGRDGIWPYRPPSLSRVEPALQDWLDARLVEEDAPTSRHA